MNYRKEIDGIRAFAVIPVVLFHAGFNFFGGGFVGVDIFFVISGYLITSLIISETQVGNFRLQDFYLRRMRRILPALFLMLLACIPLAMITLLPTDLKEFSQSLVSTILFSSNILFWIKTGYFSSAAELKPLLHTWSLSIEEQYYIFFPLLVIVIAKFKKIDLFWVLALLAMLGFWMALSLVEDRAVTAFYFLPARGWEIICGALVAIYLDRKNSINELPLCFHQSLSIFGLLLILYSIFQFNNETPFPSVWTLLPVTGTMLLIVFTTKATIVYSIFSNRVFVAIGLMSYSIYLWHQPLFAFMKYRMLDEPSAFTSLVLILFVFIISFLSWKFVEAPFRNKKIVSNKMLIISMTSLSIVIFSIGMMGHLSNGFIDKDPPKHLKRNFFYDLNTSFMNEKIETGSCKESKKIFCQLKEVSQKKVLLIGDSHSGDFHYYFEQFINKNNINGAHLSIGGCSFSPSSFEFENGDDCRETALRWKEIIDAQNVKKIIFIANLYQHFEHLDNNDLDSNLNFLAQNFTYALDRGVQVYFFTPRESLSHPLARAAFVNKLNRVQPQHDKYQAKIERYFTKNLESKGLKVFDQRTILSSASCNKKLECVIGMKEGRPLYRDSNHLSGYGADFIFNEFLKAF